uniref:RING-type domain-containing protein n=1 Tax=Timema poppense TaxID=170557 RepID=A0A7R9GYV7_TIMPO|nr:unnamed protein product [Timema poppensis]
MINENPSINVVQSHTPWVRVWWRKCCGRSVEMISGSTYHPSDNQGQDAEQGDGPPQVRNPLLCFLCDDYYSEPCLLGCYHTFCARCLRGRELDSKIACPLCGQQTMLRDGTTLPPADLLMRQLIDLANAENPPCANCDKRDKTSMYFCSTCGIFRRSSGEVVMWWGKPLWQLGFYRFKVEYLAEILIVGILLMHRKQMVKG